MRPSPRGGPGRTRCHAASRPHFRSGISLADGRVALAIRMASCSDFVSSDRNHGRRSPHGKDRPATPALSRALETPVFSFGHSLAYHQAVWISRCYQ